MFFGKTRSYRVPAAALAVLLCATTLFAQRSGSRLEGTVRDSQGLVIPGALVVAINQATNMSQESYTNDRGIYVFPLLSPGPHTVTAEMAGFKKASVTDFQLEVATTKTLDLILAVGEITETVSVKADSIQQVQTATSDLGDVVFERKIKELPLNGRLPIELMFLQPGMAGNNKQSSVGGLSASGSRVVNNALAMDGVDITNSELGTGSTSGIQIATDITPSVDVIQEFRLITANPSAEYGRVSGFQVEIATKSGTNELHGSAYEFYRHTNLNANYFFNNASPTPRRRPPLIRHQFGGTLGGPVYLPWLYNGKNKTFFFANYELMRQTEDVVVDRTVYTNEAKQGLFRFITSGVTRNPDTGAVLTSNSRVVVDPATGKIRPGVEGIQTLNVIDADKKFFDGIGADTTGMAKKILDAIPLPNDFGTGGDGLNTAVYRWNAPANLYQDLMTIKLDQVLTQNHSLSFRGNYGRLDRIGDTINANYAPFPGGQTRSRLEDQSGFSVNVASRLRPTVTNEFRIGLSRNIRLFSTTIDVPGTLAITPGTITNPFLIAELQKTPRQTFQISNNVSWIKASHSFKGGFSFYSTPLNQVFGANRISLNFSSAQTGVGGAQVNIPQLFGDPNGPNPIPSANRTFAGDFFNFHTGRIGATDSTFYAISDSEFGPLGTGKIRGFRSRNWGGFFQDDWKFSRKLTLNLGVRWDWYQVPWEVNSFYVLNNNRSILAPQLDPSMAHTPLEFGRIGPKFGTQIFKNDFNNFAPSVGFAYDPFGNNKTSIRGSYRISYDHLYSRTLDTMEQRTPGLNGAGQLNGGQLALLHPLTNVFGQPRLPRLADLSPAATNTGLTVGSGKLNLYNFLDITQTQKPLKPIANTRESFNPSEFEPGLVNPYSQSWSFGIQREFMRNTVLEVRYVGRKGAKEYGGLSANQFRAPADILAGLQEVQSLLKLTNAEAYARAGVTLPGTLSPTALITIGQLYGTTTTTASTMAHYTPGALAKLAPQSLFKLFLAGNATFDSDVQTRIINNDLAGIIAQFDTSTNFHSNAFLTAAGLNPLPAGANPRGWLPLAVGLPENAFRPNLQFLNGPRIITNAMYSSYHGLQAQVNRRFYKGLQFQANYTWSKNMDITAATQPTGQDVTEFFARNLDKSVSSNDISHNFKANFIWELPFGAGRRFASGVSGWLNHIIGGWQLTSIIDVATDYPMGISYGSQAPSWQGGRMDFNPNAKITSKTNDIGKEGRDAQGRVTYFTLDDWAGIFQPAKLGTVGTVPPNWLRGPGFWLVDMSALKNFQIAEGKELQFRAEFFNVFNNVNFGNPTTNLESASFGQITSQLGDPRIIQFALKFYF